MDRLIFSKRGVIILFFVLLFSGCSPSYKPPARPYYSYPPPAPSISEAELSQKTPSVNQPPLSSPMSSSSIVEKTLEDSKPATQKTPTRQELPTKPSTRKEPPPQTMASVKMVDNARQLRVNGKVDEAIRTLERAIELDPYNGEAFYELALCWKTKGNTKKALSFADRAEQMFYGNQEKLKKVYILKAQLLESSGKKEEAQKYRQKVK